MKFVKKLFPGPEPEPNPAPRREFMQNVVSSAHFADELNYGDWVVGLEQTIQAMPEGEGRAFWGELVKTDRSMIEEAGDIIYAHVAGYAMPEHIEVTGDKALSFARCLILEAISGDLEIRRAATIHHAAPVTDAMPDAYAITHMLFARMMNGAQLYRSRIEKDVGTTGRG